jgi:type IV pilus assembly protein PilC
MTYSYKVKDDKGVARKGQIEASSIDEAISVLREKDYTIIDVKEKGKAEVAVASTLHFSRISFSDIVNFTRQLSIMITAGLTLVDSIALLAEQAGKGGTNAMLADILTEIKGGNPLAKALDKYPKHFDRAYRALISAGEHSGKLDEVLSKLADNLEKERSFRSTVKTAMIYPIIVVLGMLGLGIMMMVVVVPKLTEIYDQFNVELPITTKMLIFTSDFLVNYWWVLVIALVGLILYIPRMKKTEVFGNAMDAFTIRLPVWGSLKKDMIMAELTRTLGLLIGAGVPIIDSLNIVSDALPSIKYSNSVKEIAIKVEKGFPLGVLFTNNPYFPPIVGHMMTVGEETGKVDETLKRIAVFFEESADQKVKRLTTALEPFILLALGIGVAFLVLSIVMPMYQLTQAF